MDKNYFEQLNAVNVSDRTEKKNGLTYLSWSWAWGELKKRYYTDASSSKMTTTPTSYPVTVYTYTETPLFSLEIGDDNGNGVEMVMRYTDDGEIRFSDEGIRLSAGETALAITPSGILGIASGGGVPLYVCSADDFESTLAAAQDGAVILKKEE